jgi:hypothetical protein
MFEARAALLYGVNSAKMAWFRADAAPQQLSSRYLAKREEQDVNLKKESLKHSMSMSSAAKEQSVVMQSQ